MPKGKPEAKIIQKSKLSLDEISKLTDVYQNLNSGMGTTSDPFNQTTWSSLGQPSRNVLAAMYIEDWATRKSVDVVTEDATRGWFVFKSSDDEAVKKLKDEVKRLDLKRKVREALRLARLFGGCLLIPEMSDGSGSLATPLKVDKIKKIKKFYVLDNSNILIEKFKRTRFDEIGIVDPLFYRVAGGDRTLIHESRTIRFDGDFVPDEERSGNGGWNNSIIIALEGALKMYSTSMQSVSTAIRDYVTKVLKVENLMQLLETEVGRTNLQSRMQLLINGASVLGMTVIGGDEEFDKIKSPTTGMPKLVDLGMDQLSAANGIPRTRFFSQQLGTLAGAESTTRDYYDFISRYQEEHLLAQLERVVQLILSSIGKGDIDWEISFKPLWQISETKKADVYKRNAETMAVLVEIGVLANQEARRILANLDVNIYTEFDIDVNKKIEPPEEKPSDPNVTIPNERPKKTEDRDDGHVHEQANGEYTGPAIGFGDEHVHELVGQAGVTSTPITTFNSHVHTDSLGNETGEAVDVSTFRSEV